MCAASGRRARTTCSACGAVHRQTQTRLRAPRLRRRRLARESVYSRRSGMRGCIAISGFQRSINVLLHGRLSGVRCGFLGLLHMDVFRQRLEHEYQVALPPWPQGPSDCPLRDLGRARVAAGRGMPAPRARAPPALSDTDARPEPSTLPARLERRVGAASTGRLDRVAGRAASRATRQSTGRGSGGGLWGASRSRSWRARPYPLQALLQAMGHQPLWVTGWRDSRPRHRTAWRRRP